MSNIKKIKNNENKEIIIFSVIFSFIIVMLIFLRIYGFGILYNVSVEFGLIDGIKNVQSIDNSSGGNDNFIVGVGNSGILNQKTYYYIYETQPDNGKILMRYQTSHVTIYNTLKESEEPYIDASDWFNIKLYLPENTIEKEI